MYESARTNDHIAHTCWAGAIAAGIVFGVAAVLTGGIAAVALAAVGGAVGSVIGSLHKLEEPIQTGSDKVWIVHRKASRAKEDVLGENADQSLSGTLVNAFTTGTVWTGGHAGQRIAQGSRTVGIQNFPAARIEDATECGGKIGEGAATVLIGGETGTYVRIKNEMPWQVRLVMGLFMIWGGAKSIKERFAEEPAGPNSCSRNKNCTKRGEPVDVATGNVVDGATDLVLDGPVPVIWRRNYCSAQCGEETSLGLGGWTHSLEQWIEGRADVWTLRTEDGRDVYFDRIFEGSSSFHRRERLELSVEREGRFLVYSPATRQTRVFAQVGDSGRALLRSVQDAHGNLVVLYYDEHARLQRIVDSAGREIHVELDALGRVERVAIWAGGSLQQWVSYEYHVDGELAGASDTLGHAARFEYDVDHRLTKTTFKNNSAFYHEYDADDGRCVRAWGADGLHSLELRFDVERRATELRASSEPRIYYWNETGRVVREETPTGECLRIVEVDKDDYVLAEGPNERSLTRYEYDVRGNRTKIVDPAGNATTWEYESDRPVHRVGPDGLVTTFENDERGTLVAVAYPSGVRHLLQHDPHGRLTEVRDGERVVAAFAYDSEHNLVREINACGAVTEYSYSPTGLPISRTDALGRVTRVTYDALGQPIAVEAPDGTVRRAEYEPLGNVSRSVDGLGQVTEMEYAGTGTLRRLVQPDGHAWLLRYDREERLSEIENPHGERYQFTYDQAGRVDSESTFDERTLRYGYSDDGRLSSIMYSDGTSRQLRYDPLGNVIDDRTGQDGTRFERDKLGRILRATLQERSGRVVNEFDRDGFGRVVEERQNGRTVRHAYDERGRRIERTLAGEATTRYGYDIDGSLAYVEHEGQRFVIERDLLGREVARRATDGHIEIHNAYDVMDRLVERHVAGGEAHATLSRRTWRYDALGRVCDIGDDRWGATCYEYDSIGQLIEARRGILDEVFRYDVTGSLRNIFRGLTDAAHVPAWDTAPGNLLRRTESASYAYDARGRRVKKSAVIDGDDVRAGAVTEYTWDERDRLREVKLPDGGRVLFTYDAFGRRIRKEVVPSHDYGISRVVEFLWDGDELAAESDSGRGERAFVHEPGTFKPILHVEQGEVFAVVNDHLGMPKELVDQGGRVAWSAAHSAWGSVVEEYRDASMRRTIPVESPFRLLGQYVDEETGLCCTRFRYFDAEVGRWCSPDPAGMEGDIDAYRYGGAPTVSVDPLGLACEEPPPTSRAARREVMRKQGIPTSEQPVSQMKNASGYSYEYEVPKAGGGTEIKSVQQQTLDSSHPGQNHWEAGSVKTDPETGNVLKNKYNRPKLTNDKSKVDY